MRHQNLWGWLFAAACVLSNSATAQNSTRLDVLSAGGPNSFVYPRWAIGPQDTVSVLVTTHCGDYRLDVDRPPEVEFLPAQTPDYLERRGAYVVDIYLRSSPGDICFASYNPYVIHPIALGRGVKGSYELRRRLHLFNQASGLHELRVDESTEFRVADAPHVSVSGAWFDPENPGVGLFLNLLNDSGDAAIYLAEKTASGEPEWYSGLGRFEGGVLRLNLTRGGAADGAVGRSFIFEYDGCGRAFTQSLPGGSRTLLAQLTTVRGVEGCRPPIFAGGSEGGRPY